ncbi:hypothetical protein WBN73_00770 [Paenarthrobacter sp. CCNWLY172]|uniref:Chitinase n=1 Tax=Arthrobacter bambusae TaxID=1338426 RepID=A0ABV2P729_9MICC
MKKFAATLLMAAVLAVTGFAAPANAEPTQDSTAIGWWPNSYTATKTNTTSIGWWPN